MAAAEDFGSSYRAETTYNTDRSSALASARRAARRNFSRNRGSRRPCQAKPTISPLMTESTFDVLSATDASDRVVQSTNTCASGLTTNVDNCERNVRQHQHRAVMANFMHWTRAGPSTRQPVRWRAQGRCSRYTSNCGIPSGYSDIAQPLITQSTGSSVDDESFGSYNTATSFSENSGYSATRGTFKRGRSYRRPRPWSAKNNRRVSIPIDNACEYSSLQQMDDQSSFDTVFTTDATLSVDVGIDQATSAHAADLSAVASNHRRNARQQSHRRQQLRSRKLVSQQNDSVSGENDINWCSVTGSHSIPLQTGMQNVETDKCMDDSNSSNDDDIFRKHRSSSVRSIGEYKTLNSKHRGFHGNRRGHSGTGRFHEILGSEHKNVSLESTDAEFEACFIPDEEAFVRNSTVEQESGRCQKNSEPKTSKSHELCEIGSILSISSASNGADDLMLKTPIASEVKQALVACEKNSVSKPLVPILVDESLLFWHLVNEHHGKCSLDKLRNQLNTSDADVAIAFLCNLKQIKILQNNSDKWMSVTFVFFKGLRVCLNAKSGCTNKKCTFLHVCPDHITDSCQAGEQCRFGHSVRIPNNELCLQKCGIQDNCSNESILAIARCSNPVICAAYNGVGELHCHNPLQCIKFHVCNNYFRSRCLILDSQCSLGHEFTSEHNGRRLQLYEVNHLLKDEKTKKTLYRMILPF